MSAAEWLSVARLLNIHDFTHPSLPTVQVTSYNKTSASGHHVEPNIDSL